MNNIMKYPCETVKDLLPLYHDDVCSESSKRIVEEHLAECESCRNDMKRIRNNAYENQLKTEKDSVVTGIFLAMMVVSIAENRVEGLALSKLMGISFLGLILIWFIPAPYHFFAAFLPSFWIGKLLIDGAGLFSFALGLLSCCAWITFFTRRFLSKI